MLWAVLAFAVAISYLVLRVGLLVAAVRAGNAGDEDRVDRLARVAFQLRVGYLALVLFVVLVAVGVAVARR